MITNSLKRLYTQRTTSNFLYINLVHYIQVTLMSNTFHEIKPTYLFSFINIGIGTVVFVGL